MPARVNKIRHDENTRRKIQASQLVNRLRDHALGKVEMTSTQVRAALGLLDKALPSLQSVDTTIEGEVTQRLISSDVVELEPDEWERRYAASLEPAARPSEGPH